MIDRRCPLLLLGLLAVAAAPEAWAQIPPAPDALGGLATDLSVQIGASPDPVTAGDGLIYTITVTNAGPGTAAAATLSDTLPANVTLSILVPPPDGWSCTAPAPGSSGTISCSNPLLDVGSSVFTFEVVVDPKALAGTILNTATVSTTTPEGGATANNSATATTTVNPLPADLSITKYATANWATAGEPLSYWIVVLNSGPGVAKNVSFSDTLPAGTTFVSLSDSAGGWSCTTPAVGAGGTVNCQVAVATSGSMTYFLTVDIPASTPLGTVIANTATATSTTVDPDHEDLTSTFSVVIVTPTELSATKVARGSTAPGGTLEYRIVITNIGSADQGDYAGDEFVDILPPELLLTGATASSGAAVADVGTNTVTWNGSIPADGSATIEIEATIDPAIAPDTEIANQGTLNWDADGDGDNEATGSTDDPATAAGGDATVILVGSGVPSVEVPGLGLRGLLALAALISAAAFVKLRR